MRHTFRGSEKILPDFDLGIGKAMRVCVIRYAIVGGIHTIWLIIAHDEIGVGAKRPEQRLCKARVASLVKDADMPWSRLAG